jgi:hypothetical protein
MEDQDTASLRKFFLRLARRAFGELGIFNAEIVDYVANVLAEFAHADSLYRLRSAAGQPLDRVVEMLPTCQAEESRAHPLLHQRTMRKYVGDYTLFMSGLFRKHVEHRGVLDFYLKEGRRSYRKVSELDLALYRTGFLVFQDLSEKFECYSGALDYMRKAHFASPPGRDPFADFLTQIDQWTRLGISSN